MTPAPPVPHDALRLCIGHSHLRSVQMAVGESGENIETINFWEQKGALAHDSSPPRFSQGLAERVGAHEGPVFSFIGGGAHTVIGMVSHPRRYDFVLPEAPDLPLDPAAEILPVDAVRIALFEQMQDYLDLMRQLRSLSVHGVVHFEPPSICRDAELMLPHIPWSLFPGMLQEIAPAFMRYKVWRLHSIILAEFCSANSIRLIGCPAESMDIDGFLLPEFLMDGIHANQRYGRMLLDRMGEIG